MTTHTTLEAARAAAQATAGVIAIAEIEHATAGRCYVCLRGTLVTLRQAVTAGKLSEVKAVIAGHATRSQATIAADREQHQATECRCERCRVHVDGRTAYHHQERMRWGGQLVAVTAYYCAGCAALLCGIGAGEYTAMQERAGTVPSAEDTTKSDM